MTADRLFTSRHEASFKMGLIASPRSPSNLMGSCLSLFMELIQGVDVNFVMPCMLPAHVSKGPFHSYGVCRHLVNRATNDVLHKNQEKLLSIFPASYPRNSPTGPLQSTPHPRAQMAGLVPVVARGIVTGLTNCTVHQ